MSRWLSLGIIILSPFYPVFAQTVDIDSGFTYREVVSSICDDPLHHCHYYKMVSWDDSQIKEFSLRRMSGSAVQGFMNFRVLFPNGWSKDDHVTKYPGIVMLHGAGEAGRTWQGRFEYFPTDIEYDNNGRNIFHGGQAHLNAVNRNPSEATSFPGFVIYPQNHHGASWESGWNGGAMSQDMENIATFLEHLISEWHLEPDRIIMHGLSNGAKGVWDFASKRPDLIAGVLPFSGIPRDFEAQSTVLVTTPVWQFQGALDANPNPGVAQQFIALLRNKGGNPILTIYESLGHGTWNTAIAEPNFFPWIKSQNKKNIYVFGGIPQICEGGSLRLGFSAGYLGYQWTFEGVDIPGATSRYYQASQTGTYTVKFRRRTNSQWDESFLLEVEAQTVPPTPPVLAKTGSAVLPMVGSTNPLALVAPTGYATYYWFKNGSPWVVNGSSTTTSNTRNVCGGACNNASFAGSYTVAVLEPTGCQSQQSDPIVVTFGTNGPPAPAKPTATALSPTQVSISWNAVAGATEYELWRFRPGNLPSGGYPQQTPYRYIKTVTTTSTIDDHLRPQALYKFSVRAVNANGGRFSPESNVASPTPDSEPPSVPQDLIAFDVLDTQLTLQWSPSIDNDVVYNYQIFNGAEQIGPDIRVDLTGDQTDGDPAPPTTYTLTGLQPGNTYVLSVRARDYRSANYSAFSDPVQITTLGSANGLAYKYYEFSGTMPGNSGQQLVEPRANNSFDFASLVPDETGNINNFNISVRNRNDQFVVAFEGFIQIDQVGYTTFWTRSDDGSRLYIKPTLTSPNWTLVVNNDGAHGAQNRLGRFNFPAAGKYRIRVTYFEQSGSSESLSVKYRAGDWTGSGTGNTNYNNASFIPDSKLFSSGETFYSYFSNGSGDLTALSSWGTEPNGGGTSPTSFNGDFQFFVVANRPDGAILDNQWEISGTSSKVIVAEDQTLTLNAPLKGVLEAKEKATINVNHSEMPGFGLLDKTSTVNFAAGIAAGIPPASYGNVNITGKGVTAFSPSNTIVKGDLIVSDGVTTVGSDKNASNLNVGGDIVFNGTTPNPSSTNRYTLTFTGGGNHTITHGASDISLFGIRAGFGDVIRFNNGTQPRTLTLGTEMGGGLSLQGDAILLMGNNNLAITGNGSVNSNDESGEISIDGGNVTISSNASLNSNLSFVLDHNTVNNLTVTAMGSGNVNIVSSLNIKDAIKVSAGELNAGDGNVTLLSNSEGTARIEPIGEGASISGHVNFQRYLEAEGRIDRYISSPVKGATVANLQETLPVTGNFAGKSIIPGNPGAVPSMFQYHLPNVQEEGWKAFPSSTSLDSLQRGKGYRVFVHEDAEPITWKLTGTPYQGNITFPLTPDSNKGNSTDGWNLLGNPYASPIQWTGGTSAGRWTSKGVGSVVYVRENSGTTTTWKVSNGSTGNLEGGIITSGQAFWVQATSADPSLTISEGAKFSSDTTLNHTASEFSNALEISVTDGNLTDLTYIQSNPEGNDAFIKAEDAVKQQNSFFNLSSRSYEGLLLAINVVSDEFCKKTISLNIENAAAGNYTMSFDGLANFYHGVVASLKDDYLGTEQPLSDGFTYNFSVTNEPSSKGARFLVIMNKPEVWKDINLTSIAACESNAIIKVANAQPGVQYQVFRGDEVVSGKAEMSNGTDFVELAVDRKALGLGSTDLLVKAGFPGCGTVSIDKVVTVTIDTLAQPEISLSENDNLIVSVSDADSYKWYFNGEFIEEETGREMVPSDVGAYTVEVTRGGCMKASDLFNYLNTGVETQPDHRVTIYPNPFDDRLTVYLNGYSPKEIVLHDMMGRVLHQRDVKPAESQVSIDVRSLVNGVYILNVGSAKYKIVKQR